MPAKRKRPTPRQRGDRGWLKRQKALAASRKRAKRQDRSTTEEPDMADYRMEIVETPVCLDSHSDPEGCGGEVEYRMPLSGTGKSFPRCDKHWDARLDRQAEIDRRYPDSPSPPADFDPTYAGERWDDDY